MTATEAAAMFGGLTDEQLHAVAYDEAEDMDVRLEAALEIGTRKGRDRDARHAAFHGHPLRYGRVGKRRGYRGDTVCLDCYRGKAWPG